VGREASSIGDLARNLSRRAKERKRHPPALAQTAMGQPKKALDGMCIVEPGDVIDSGDETHARNRLADRISAKSPGGMRK